MSEYGIDSIHIAIGAGDCAIHLLIENPAAAKPIVHNAVLIDGGKNQEKVYINIRKAMDIIETKYDMGLGGLRFDSIVITHWDDDHYGGIIKLIKDDIKTQLKSAKPPKPEDLLVSFMKYTGNDRKKPETVLYAPYWDERPGKGKKKANGHVKEFANTTNAQRLDFNYGEESAAKWATEICQLKFDEFLGVNFLTNAGLPSDKGSPTIKKPLDLVAANPPAEDGMPGIYCVASDQLVLGQSKGAFFIIDVDNLTLTNKCSIGAMVIWKDGHLSHYFSGDADFETETAVTQWSQTDGGDGVGKSVVSMKLSHHGAVSSTPTTILDKFNPKNMIISCGTGYGHPRWELLLYVHAWMLAQGIEKAGSKPIFTTQYPYWLALKDGDYIDYSKSNKATIFIKNPTSKPVVEYFTALQALYDKINLGTAKAGGGKVTNIYKQFTDWVAEKKKSKAPTISEMYGWIVDQVAKRWDIISHIPETAHPASSAATSGASTVAVLSTKRTVQYIRVACRKVGDGAVLIKYAEDTNETAYHKPIVVSSSSASAAGTKKGTKRPSSALYTSITKKTKVTGAVTLGTGFKPATSKDADEGDISMDDDEDSTELDTEMELEPLAVGGAEIEEEGEDEDDTSTDDGGVYFYCSQLDEKGEGVHVLSAGVLDDFVTLLHRGVVALEAEPAKPSTTFLGTDEWWCWFKDCISATSLSVIGDETSNIEGFRVAMLSPTKSASDILFSTEYIDYAFDLQANLNGVPKPGLLGDVDILVFGLDPTLPAVNMAFPDVFEYAGLTEFAESFWMALLREINVTLEPKASQGRRNAIWFDPTNSYKTVVRLQFALPASDLSKFNDVFSFLDGFKVKSADMIVKKTSTWTMSTTGVGIISDGEVIMTAECDINGVTFEAALTFQKALLKFDFSTKDGSALEAIIGWLAKLVGLENIDFQGWLKKAGNSLGTPQLRRISLTIKPDDNGQHTVTDFNIDMEIGLNFGKGKDVEAVVFLLTYSWAKGQKFGALRGALWCAPPASAILPFASILPDWEEYLEFKPITPGNLGETLDLAKLIPSDDTGVTNIPQGIPTEICQAYIEIDDTGIAFFGAISCNPPDAGNVPIIYLDKIGLDAKYTFGGGGGKGSFDLSFEMEALIQPNAGSQFQTPSVMKGAIKYNSGEWHLNASLQDLYASTLYSFFDNDSRDSVMTFLERLEIKTLALEYNYIPAPGGAAKDFLFTGVILLGKLELDLKFTHDGKGWKFNAALGADSTETTNIGDIVTSITGSTEDLPDFVTNIEVGKPNTADDLVSINCEKITDELLFFAASVHIGPLEFTFAQYRGVKWPANVASKKAIKVSVKQLPEIDIPIIGNLTQPFDEMFYMWVQDRSGRNDAKAAPGLTRAEVKSINDQVTDKLMFKETSKTPADTDVVIEAGSHFVLVLKGEKDDPKVIIDYVFGKPTSKSPEPALLSGPEGESNVTASDSPKDTTAHLQSARARDSNSTSSGSSMAAYKKSIGPLSISNIGFKYKDGSLSVLLDATFVLGPIGFTLLGFSIGINLSGGFTLQKLPAHLDVSLSGLSVEFDRPPIAISGLYEYVKTEKLEYYAGGVIVAFAPYLFEAAGFYGITPDPNSYKTVFIFGKLEGPLVTLEFAEISGITGGFGYNTDLKFPSIAQVTEFPFLAMKVPDKPMDTLIQLTKPGGWFNPRNESFWVAAGLKVSAFQTLAIDAVVVVEWNPYVNLGIFGVAVANLPVGDTSGTKFAHVELGISATVDFHAGVMKFEAQLSPNSYILSPNCHLTGGFALYYWFKGSDPQLEGDWVFTIGGYHQAFQPPSQYPNPPRLAISWSLDDSLSITGQAYFAITPKVCMGGGRLHAALSLGPLYAFFDAYADFLINYKPFHFMAEGGVSVGVRFTLDLWIVTIHISVEIGAQLLLVGPPMSGTVHVDFWVFGFDIHFGPGAPPITPVDLETFYKLVLTSGTAALSAANMLTSSEDEKEKDDQAVQPHLFGCQSGLITGGGSQVTPPNTPWNVRAGNFSFGISCRFAINSATFTDDTAKIDWSAAIYAKPMNLETALTSTLQITIVRTDDNKPDGPVWKIDRDLKSVPNALWGKYDPTQDPSQAGNNISGLLDGGNVATSLMMGVIIRAPDPVPSNDVIPKFNAVDAMSEEIFPQGEEKIFPPNATSSGNWLPLKAAQGSEQWSNVKTAWQTPKTNPQKTVDLWANAFSWDTKLDGSLPPILLKKFDELYLAAPLLCVA